MPKYVNDTGLAHFWRNIKVKTFQTAQQVAETAQETAQTAQQTAQTAQENANDAMWAARESASVASSAATAAANSASNAEQEANSAAAAANNAQISANAAQQSASNANAHAIAALNSLSTVEDVVDTLTWITTHGTMTQTTDTEIDPTKIYFIRDDNGEYVVNDYHYSSVLEPNTDELSLYYELSIDKSIENYIATHLSLTNQGLWLTPTTSNAYRVLIATGSGDVYTTPGTYIIDDTGTTVAHFTSTGIGFASDRSFYIGDRNAYIFFEAPDNDNDNIQEGRITIGGDNVTIGGDLTLEQLIQKYDSTITSEDLSINKSGNITTITFGDDSVDIIDGTGEQGPKGDDGTSITINSIEYGISTDATVEPSNWSTTVPTSVAQGSWFWVKTTYSDDSTAITKSYTGTDGEKGDDGTSIYVQSAERVGDSTLITIFDSQGNQQTFTIKDGQDGANGIDGQNGLNGIDGTSSYIHTAWANSADGSQGFSTSVSENKKYLGVYTDNTPADSQIYSNYSWSLIKGADGTSVNIDSIQYGISSNATTEPSNWDNVVPATIMKGSWLWVKTTYNDNSTAITKSYVGTDGEDGTSVYIQSVHENVIDNSTTVVIADSTGHTETLTIENGQDGTDGQDGQNGYVHIAWANSADGSQGFSTSISTGRTYLGVYTDNTVTDSEDYSDYSWSLIKGADGQAPVITTSKNNDGSVTIYINDVESSTISAGKDGSTPIVTTGKNSDGSVTIYINGAASNTIEAGSDGTSYYTYVRYSANANGSNMVAIPSSTTKYIGIYTGTSSTVPAYRDFTWNKYIGEDGIDADPLTVTYVNVDYQLSTNGTTPPIGPWSETPIAPTTTQYLWTRTTITFSDNTTATSYSVGGKAGQDGANGGRWYTGTKITGTSATATVFSDSNISAAIVGDMYLNTSTYNTYRCTTAGNASTAKWIYVNNIKGNSITNVEHQYYLSTSSVNPPSQNDVEWKVTPDPYSEGCYYWERWKITFSNSNSVQYTTPTLAEEITSAWTAIERTKEEINLRATKTELYQNAQPNLAPIGSVEFSNIYNEINNPNGYWHIALNNPDTWFSQLNDGWIHVFVDNSEGNVDLINLNFNPGTCFSITPGNPYTILTEIRNNISTGIDEDNTGFHLESVDNNQFWGNIQNEEIDEDYITTSTEVQVLTCGQTHTLYSYQLADILHLANINKAIVGESSVGQAMATDDNNNINPFGLFCYSFQCAAGSILDFDFRLSIYDGIYSGPYKPYVGAQLYASQSELKITSDGINSKVSQSDYNGATIASLINQTSESVTIDADKINLNGAVTIGDLATATQAAVLNSYVQSDLNTEIKQRKATYGTCNTAAATAAKVVTCSNFALYTGAQITVRFVYGNTAASPTLNVNGTGAKPVQIMNNSQSDSSKVTWPAYSNCTFTYDGTYWRFTGNDYASTTATNYITAINNNGIKIHDAGVDSNYLHLTSSGSEIYQEGKSVASFGSSARIGASDQTHIRIDSDSLDIYSYSDTDEEEVLVARFGALEDGDDNNVQEGEVFIQSPIAGMEVYGARPMSRYRTIRVLENINSLEQGEIVQLASPYVVYDANGAVLGYNEIVKNSIGNLYLSHAVRRPGCIINGVEKDVVHAFYMHIDEDGKRSVSFTEPSVWKAGLKIGDIVTSAPNAVSVSTNTATSLGSITLAAGKWVITVSTTFESNANGRRAIYFSSNENESSIGVSQMAALAQAPANGGTSKYSSTAIVEHGSSTTYYCRAWQNSTSTLSCQCFIRAIRIA